MASEFETVCVGSFSLPQEAAIARTLLEAEGVECYIENENTIRQDWLLSNAIGGVRVVVQARDAEKAREILTEGQLVDPLEFQNQGDASENFAPCPQCKSNDISYKRFNKRFTALCLLLFRIPIPMIRERYHCNSCGNEWPVE